jgi:hypothetical protein
MYHHAGAQVCDVGYYDAPAGSERTYVERWGLLGYEHPAKLPKKLRLVGVET